MRKFSVAILALTFMISCSEKEYRSKNEKNEVYYVNNAFYCELVDTNLMGNRIHKCVNNESVCYLSNFGQGISCYSTLNIDDGNGKK